MHMQIFDMNMSVAYDSRVVGLHGFAIFRSFIVKFSTDIQK